LALYWGLSTVETLKFCTRLFRKTALLHSFEGMAIRLHDVFRDYLLRQHTPSALAALHTRLITAWGFDPSPAPPHRDGEGNSEGEVPGGHGTAVSLQPAPDKPTGLIPPLPPERAASDSSERGGEVSSPSLPPATDRFGGKADPYAWRYAGYHLVAAGRAETLRDLLLDYRWLRAKLNATDLPALLDDCDRLPAERRLPLLRQTLTLSANTLAM
ncbi:MAG: hypothetical protein JNJ78_25665, partial [Anaerolineae bacterium]|nr:hypothetical protein [Anaerolineae bacterium]